jgi:hypothetical protein
MGHTLRSGSLLHLKASCARVFQSGLRLADVRRWVVHVAPLRRLHQDQVEDGWIDVMGCVRPCYPCFIIFYVLDHRGIVVF